MMRNKILIILVFFSLGLNSYADLLDSFDDNSKNLDEEILPNVNEQIEVQPSPKNTKAVYEKESNKQHDPGLVNSSHVSEKKAAKNKSEKAKAKNGEKRPPVHFKSLGLTGDKDKNEFQLHKDVLVTQGDLRLESNEARVLLNDGSREVDKVFAEGNVKIVKKDESSGKLIRANGDKADFDNGRQEITLRGNAHIHKGDDVISGSLVTYNLKTGIIKVEKVKGIVSP